MKNKPYKYSSKDRLEKTPNKKKKKTTEKVSENTVKIDEGRFKHIDSLDSSFLEARVEKKEEKNSKVKDNSEIVQKIRTLRKIFLVLSLICVVLLLFLYSSDAIKASLSSANKLPNVEEEVTKKKNQFIDSNYLFVGDYHTDSFPLQDFGLDYHYVKSSNPELTTKDIITNMKDLVYSYNPSIVFIELGKNNLSKEEYLNDISTIIRLVQENRPYAELYIESIYPVSSSYKGYTNIEARDLNQSLQRLCDDNKVGYLDIYSMLIKNNELDKDYTDDGVHLNKKGYQQVYKVIQKVIG